MTKVEGEVVLRGSTAYAPQNPWIMSSSVRDNITFFRKFDQAYYDLVLDGMCPQTFLRGFPERAKLNSFLFCTS